MTSDALSPACQGPLFERLMSEHSKALLAYTESLVQDRYLAEDIVQETLIRAWQRLERLYNTEGSVRGWLLTVVRNIVTDQIRARNARATEVRESPVEVAIENDHADDVVNSVVVVDALSRLSTEHREVLEQVYLLGSTVAEAAKTLGIPPGTVKSRSFYALRALRELRTLSPAGTERSAS